MVTEPILAALDAAVVQRGHSARSSVLSDYWALTKPEINFLIAIATVAAFCLGCPAPADYFPWALLLHTLLGTILVASGASSLNQLVERNLDAQMRRTARRPIVAGRIEPVAALVFGTLLSVAGGLYLGVEVRPAASLLALLTLGGYLFLYTPLKRRTPLCTLVGAFPGAMPVLIGYVAAAGKLDAKAWLLYAILFFWQFPHFMAIAWMYREDYARAGFLVLPSSGLRNRFVICQSFGVSLLFLPLAMIPAATGELHLCYSVEILAVSFLFSYYAASFAFRRSNVTARRLLVASIIYLPAIFVLMMLSKR
jgi:protoheme IX farnesyltransferase